MKNKSEVVIIGGGATGVGTARDLAMRGVEVTLIEKGDLSHGTSGNMSGLLHSGGRYAVTDKQSAKECIKENQVLRRIAPHCIEMTQGLFVQLDGDDDDYFQKKLDSCRECNIPTEVLSGEQARELEPQLNEKVQRAIKVPDGALYPFRIVVATALSAENYGANIQTNTEVVDIHTQTGQTTGVEIKSAGSKNNSESKTIRANHVVNAAGAWSHKIGAMVEVDINITLGKGAMAITDGRPIDTAINRCRPRASGDAIVPYNNNLILGTTDEEVNSPSEYPKYEREIEFLIEETSEMAPVISDEEIIRSYWGVRPLYTPPESEGQETEKLTRAHALIDHAVRDDISGLTTIVGGKLTTYRKMAEEVSDHVCDTLGMDAECKTAEEKLPGISDQSKVTEAMKQFNLVQQSLIGSNPT